MTEAGAGRQAEPGATAAAGGDTLSPGDPGHDEGDAAHGRRTRLLVVVAGIVLTLVAAVGVLLVIGFVDAERSRDLRAWQTRLGIIADTRAAAIRDWVQDQVRSLRDVANNDSVRLLMTELSFSGWDIDEVPDGEAQRDYIRIFLVSTASATGFAAAARGPEINANVTRVGTAGLAILSPDNQLVVATPDMPPLDSKLRDFLEARKPGEAAVMDMYLSPSGELSMAFVQPIYAVQSDPSAEAELGAVIGIRPVQAELERRLVQPGDTSRASETLLVREADGQAQYLTGLADGAQPLERKLSRGDPDLAANRALNEPGAFGQQVDYRNQPVVMTSRAIEGTPWVLLRKIDQAEALEETEYRARVLLATLIGAILLVAIVVVAVWRHGTSMRAAQSAARYRRVAERLDSLSGFLQVVTDNQPTAITAVDAGNRITFVNRQAAASVRQDPADLVGKDLGAAFGPALAEELEELNRRARKKGRTMTEIRHRHVAAAGAKNASDRVLKSDHIPLPPEGGRDGAVLMVETDITEVERERARREQSMRQLVETLVALIDRRDPYAANHSKRVTLVAAATAREMGATDIDIRTVEIAAAMTNLGKIAVPEHILAKTDKLSDAELALVRNSIQMSADLLEGVEFDGPVVETLRQMQEHWDGTGMPGGLKGEAILPTARIVALANDFVAMASPRAWRSGLDFDAITGELMKNAGTKYERKVVIALVNHLDNRGGREAWAHFGKAEPEAEANGAG